MVFISFYVESKTSPDQAVAFLSIKLGCTLCEKCALVHFEMLGSECSDVHALTQHSKIPYFDPAQRPIEVSVSKKQKKHKKTQKN